MARIARHGETHDRRNINWRVLTLCPDSSSLCLFECGPSPLNAILNAPLNDAFETKHSADGDGIDNDRERRESHERAVYNAHETLVPCQRFRTRKRGKGEGGENNNR